MTTLITLDELSKAVPSARADDLAKYLSVLDDALTRYTIDTPPRIAAFVAQVAHESGDFRYSEENLNYSWRALRLTWPTRFPAGTARKIGCRTGPRHGPSSFGLPLTLPSPPSGATDQNESLSLGEGEGWVRVALSANNPD
jgi:hypothetical protein